MAGNKANRMAMGGLACLALLACAHAWSADGNRPRPARTTAKPVERCRIQMQAPDLTWSSHDVDVRVGSLGADEPFVLPAAAQATARAVECLRASIVPMESDWKVVALDLPLVLHAGKRSAVLERDHDRARYVLRKAEMSSEERAAIGAYVEATNANLAKVERVRRPDMHKGMDLRQLDCQDMARLVVLDADAEHRAGDWLVYGRDRNGDGVLGCGEFNYTTRVTEVDDEGYTLRVIGRDGQTGPIADHHPMDEGVMEQFGAAKAWLRAR